MVTAVGILIVSLTVIWVLVHAWILGPNPWRDGDAYLNAALRIRAGQPIYPALADPQAPMVYRYAPWFAWAWVSLSYLPREVVIGVWQTTMLLCSALAIMPAWRAGIIGRAMALAAAPLLVMASLWGNVQPAIVLILVYTVRHRAGPLAIAIAASLKVFPILYVITYLARREWGAASLTTALTVVLWAPAFMVGFEHYPMEVGTDTPLWALSPAIWGLVVVTVGAIAYLVGRRREAWYASSLLVTLGTPRLIGYDWTFLLVGPSRSADGSKSGAAGRPDSLPERVQ